MNKRMVEGLENEAARFQAHGQYLQAAEKYEQVAQAYLDENTLIYARYSHEALRMWLKAKDVTHTMAQARAAFRVLSDTGWLEKSMEQVIDLILIIAELKEAGYVPEAGSFAQELNAELGKFGLMLKPASENGGLELCPGCGARLPLARPGESRKCDFCGYMMAGN